MKPAPAPVVRLLPRLALRRSLVALLAGTLLAVLALLLGRLADLWQMSVLGLGVRLQALAFVAAIFVILVVVLGSNADASLQR